MSKLLDIINSPWALEPMKLDELIAIYGTHVRGEKIDIAALEAQMGRPLANEQRSYDVRDGVAIVDVDGVMAPKANLFMKVSGGSSTQMIERDVKMALDDPRVHAIVLAIDSPGGSVGGVQQLANTVFAGRGRKPIVALADHAGSAAYWLASAAEDIYITGDTVMTGSIGVVTKHVDTSRAEEKAGIKVTEVFSGKYKRIASEHAPLTDEGRAHLQAITDDIYSAFVNDVARNRARDAEAVLEKMAEGRVFVGRKAIDAGLVDGVSTLDALIADLSAGRKPASRMKAAGAAAKSTHSKGNGMDKDFIVANHPDIAEAFRSEGYTRGLAEGREQGATAERERIKGVRAAALPGHEALVETLMCDGKTSPGDAALQVNGAERQKMSGRLAQIEKDGKAIAHISGAPSESGERRDPAAAPPADPNASFEERCKAEWEKDARARANFGENGFKAFLRMKEAEAQGRVRIFSAGR
jgi:signal peptide peptidase SppA